MTNIQAIFFDLDDTLLDRNKAVDKMFLIILDKYYDEITDGEKNKMLKRFKDYDSRAYGQNDKAFVLEAFFNEFPPIERIQRNALQKFWNEHFPMCFSINENVLHLVNAIKEQVKVAIITNGSTQRQYAKISNTNLHCCFDSIFISEEVGISKPDKRIFEFALNKLNVKPEATLFVGDDLEKDIGGCQNANVKGIWFNPNKHSNDTNIKPFAEIHSLNQLINYVKVP